METFGQKISAEACSGKEIAGLLKKMMMMMMMMMMMKNQSVGRRSNVGTARVKSHVIRVQNASKLGEKA